jgi:hypothetical protein
MSAYSEFFLNSPSSIVQLELLMISHPSFTQDYRIVRNAVNGVTVEGLGSAGINLFNPSDPDVVTGKYVHPNGSLSTNASYTASGYVPLVPGTTYTRHATVSFYAYYDQDQNFLSEYQDNTVGTATFTVPEGVAYGRFSIINSHLSTFRIVRGTSAGDPVDYGEAPFTYYPLRIVGNGTRENLDFGIRIDLGDLGEVLPLELDNIATDLTYGTLPVIRYWTYRSDDLTTPLYGPLVLEAKNVNFTREGATLDAKAPSLNVNRTGERYKTSRFPMLRGFL